MLNQLAFKKLMKTLSQSSRKLDRKMCFYSFHSSYGVRNIRTRFPIANTIFEYFDSEIYENEGNFQTWMSRISAA